MSTPLLLPRHLVRAWAKFKGISIGLSYKDPEITVTVEEWNAFMVWIVQDMMAYNGNPPELTVQAQE